MPSIPANLDWLFYAIGGLLALGSVWLLVWALFRDRARARFRCPKCWYDLTGPEGAAPAVPVTCSECGKKIGKERLLRKRKKRWRWAVVALGLLLMSGGVASYPRVHRFGWCSLLPTWFLIDTIPKYGYPSPLTDELVRRLQGLQIQQASGPQGPFQSSDLAELGSIIKRISTGTPSARPGSARWQQTYGELIKSNLSLLTFLGPNRAAPIDPALEKAISPLYEIPPQITLHARTAWPKEFPLWIGVNVEHWWPGPVAYRIEALSPETQEFEVATTGILIDWPLKAPSGVLDIELRANWDPGHSMKTHTSSITVPVSYAIKDSITDVLTPVSGPSLDQFVTSLVTSSGNRLRVQPTVLANQQVDGFGIIAEFSVNGVLVDRSRIWWRSVATYPISWNEKRVRAKPGERYDWKRLENVQSGENWTVRIRSDPETALRVIDAEKYWQGDVTIPVTIK